MKTLKEILEATVYGSVTSALLCLLLGLSGCATKDPTITINTPVYGVYHVQSGTYDVYDSNGVESHTEFTGEGTTIIPVDQSGDVVNIMGCFGVLTKEDDVIEVTCDSRIYMIDMFSRLYLKTVVGSISLDTDSKVINTAILVTTTFGDYTIMEELNIGAVFSQEFTDVAEGNGTSS